MFHAFESSVNSEGIETWNPLKSIWTMFESSVNSEGIETVPSVPPWFIMFESSVNSEGIETYLVLLLSSVRLRAV